MNTPSNIVYLGFEDEVPLERQPFDLDSYTERSAIEEFALTEGLIGTARVVLQRPGKDGGRKFAVTVNIDVEELG